MADHNFESDTRLAFLNMDRAVLERLPEAWRIIEPQLADILDRFYRHVVSIPSLANQVGSQENIERLKRAQSQHWQVLFSGQFDERYFERVTRIGMAHFRIGLEPRWYMAAYSFIIAELTALITARYGKKHEAAAETLNAAIKVIFLDMDLAISVYYEAMSAEQKTLTDKAVTFVQEVRHIVDGVSAAATELQATAESMTQSAQQGAEQSTAVAASSEEASTNVQAVATAAEELSASLGEVSRQVNQSSEVTGGAVRQAETANDEVSGLSQAADRIGEVVNMIQDIANQTNLLALNATIEAARAGEAGKGFAVVASEVKALAGQTAKATEEISQQIASIQEATGRAVGAIGSIGGTIGEVNEIASAIAAAVEQQNAATGEISSNAQQAATGTQEVSKNVAQVSQGLSETGHSAGEVLSASNDLSRQSESLKQSIDRFLAELESAA